MSDLSEYFGAIRETIIEKVSSPSQALRCEVMHFEHSDPAAKLSLPLVLIGVANLDQVDEFDSADSMTFSLSMEAHCILPSASCDDVHAMNFAMSVISVLNRETFDLEYVSYPESFEIHPSEFISVKRGYEARVVQWRQVLTLDLDTFSQELNSLLMVDGRHTLSGTTEPEHRDQVIFEPISN